MPRTRVEDKCTGESGIGAQNSRSEGGRRFVGNEKNEEVGAATHLEKQLSLAKRCGRSVCNEEGQGDRAEVVAGSAEENERESSKEESQRAFAF